MAGSVTERFMRFLEECEINHDRSGRKRSLGDFLNLDTYVARYAEPLRQNGVSTTLNEEAREEMEYIMQMYHDHKIGDMEMELGRLLHILERDMAETLRPKKQFSFYDFPPEMMRIIQRVGVNVGGTADPTRRCV